MDVCVTGAGGFIGHHLVSFLKEKGYRVCGVDIKYPEFEKSRADVFRLLDLRSLDNALQAIDGFTDRVYHLAANMGGIGFIETNKADIVHDNTLIDFSVLEAARFLKAGRLFYSSSACIYPVGIQKTESAEALRENMAYPADPEDGYGWEKLYIERMCRHYREEFGLETRVARFHNIYGPLGTYDGGREKSPAAICRKVALAKDGSEVEIWGNGTQSRSYCYVQDCVRGIDLLTESDFAEPVNIGRNDPISINGLLDIVSGIAGKRLRPKYDLSKPQGVRGRNADTSLLRQVTGWEPPTDMVSGLRATYVWIKEQLFKSGRM